jgi:hypothetical protein
MAVIMSLDKIHLLKNVGIPEYYLGGNVEFLNFLDVPYDWSRGFAFRFVVQMLLGRNCQIKKFQSSPCASWLVAIDAITIWILLRRLPHLLSNPWNSRFKFNHEVLFNRKSMYIFSPEQYGCNHFYDLGS